MTLAHVRVVGFIVTLGLSCAGAYFGKGKNGGDMTIFLMGCYDPTVCE